VGQGEIVGVVGASGCGKSTLLRLLAGLEKPSAGTASLDGAPLVGPRDEIGVVFQEPRLMPWLSVEANVAFGLRQLPAAERNARVGETLERVGLSHFAKALPRELSGGMAQRVAIARALAARPKVLLLDEPFSALDAFTRLALQEHLLQLWSYDRPTFVLVTHDIDEALALADRIVLMRGHPGRVHREFAVDLPRPRSRSAPRFLAWKEEVLRELHITAASGRSAISAPLLRAASH
jgi:sulfonate transport system ATP-binding protein